MIFTVEKWLKEKAFDCQACGQCLLSHTELICPMTCPKGLRNGPCGGTLDGKCEVLPDIDCVWTRIEKKKEKKRFDIHAPYNPDLLNTASYVNWLLKRDIATRVPRSPVDSSRMTPTSELARKMSRGEFVVTLEIASPLTEQGLTRVRGILSRTAQHVDAVNTTTNAGGVPSLHSTETARVVREYGVEPIIQFCGRDANEVEFRRQFDSALEQGFENFLFLTGDWQPQNARRIDQATWFPMDSAQMIHCVNAELEELSRRCDRIPYLGVAANPFSTPTQISVDRLRLKREAGARFCQTQAITNAAMFQRWYERVRVGRESEPKLTIPSIPLVGSQKAFQILCRLPGVYVDESLHRVMAQEDFSSSALDWAFQVAESVIAAGSAGIHVMNFGMPPQLMDEFLMQIRDRAESVRA